MQEHHGGQLPANRQQLLALPGIGDYTTGAILSIAFGQDEPAVDGNVRRVLCRLFAFDEDLRKAAAQRRLRELAGRLLPPGQAGDFNQGLMHLGAMVCTPRQPQCGACPLARLCEGRRLNLVGADGRPPLLPRRVPRRAVPHYQVAAAVIWNDDGRVLIAQRQAGDMLGGLWEFPGGRCEPGETLAECLRREIREELGLEIAVGEPVTSVRHAYSHFRITLHAFHCRVVNGEAQSLGCADVRWVSLSELVLFPFSVADQKIIAALQEHRDQRSLYRPQERNMAVPQKPLNQPAV